MDRFIVGIDSYDISNVLFKIQYGQIYSFLKEAEKYV